MATVTIDGTIFQTHATVAETDAYLKGNDNSAARAWRKLGDLAAGVTAKSRKLVEATRWIEDLELDPGYVGERVGDPYPNGLAFPRTGTDNNGRELDPDATPYGIVRACMEAAALMTVDKDAAGKVDQGSNIQSLQAGAASISYFAATSAAEGTARELPKVLDLLLGPYLETRGVDGSSVSAGGSWFGARSGSYMDDCYTINRNKPL